MFDVISKGGPVMILILMGSVLFIAIFVERLYHYHSAQIDTNEFIAGIRNIMKKGNVAEAISICEETPGPVAHIIKAALLKHDRSREEISKTIEDAAMLEVPRLEKNLVVLATIAHISPLLGLFGTVVGMIQVFMKIQEMRGIINTEALAGGIWVALITTAAGLAVAIPAFVAYNYLVSRVNGLVLDMEKSATEVVDLLQIRTEDYEV